MRWRGFWIEYLIWVVVPFLVTMLVLAYLIWKFDPVFVLRRGE
jgi:lipid-A-disaccharide synthase-like uncharacterized protein